MMRVLKQQRRGQAEMLEWFPRLILMAIAVVVIVVFVRVFTNREPSNPDVDRGAYLYRIYYGDVIMYKDEDTGRVYPGIIDVSKFSSKRLDDVFSEKDSGKDWGKMASMLVFTPSGSCGITYAAAIYNDKDTFQKTAPFTSLKVSGAESGTKETALFPVTLKNDDLACAGVLNITIVRPNS